MKFFRGKRKIWIALFITGIITLSGYYIVGAGTVADPGTDADPAVAKSYVDEQMSILLKKVDELTLRLTTSEAKLVTSETKATALETKLAEKDKQVTDLQSKNTIIETKLQEILNKNTELEKKVSALATKSGNKDDIITEVPAPSTKAAIYQVVKVKAGKRLIAGASTEIIVRLGRATVVGTANGGVLDISSSVVIATGKIVPLNHLLLSQLSDGKGFKAVTDVTILIRGPYQIK